MGLELLLALGIPILLLVGGTLSFAARGANGEGIRLGVIAGQPTAHRSQLQALRLLSAAFNLFVHLPMIAPQERQQDCSMISLLQDFSLIISSLHYQAM